MSGFSEFLAEQLQNPDVKREYDALEAEYLAKQAVVNQKCDDNADSILRNGGNHELS